MIIDGVEVHICNESSGNVGADGKVVASGEKISKSESRAVWNGDDFKSIDAHILNESGVTDQDVLRQAIAEALSLVQDKGLTSVGFPILGCDEGDFPVTGSAKILLQEIIKLGRHPEHSIKDVYFCIKDKERFELVDKTIRGYVAHFQKNLGPEPYVCTDILIERPDGLVIIERSNPPFGWALPGGFLDRGESLETAARREAMEETGLELEGLRQFHTYSEPTRDPRFHTISTVFIAQGIGTPQFGDDAKGLKVIPFKDLMSNVYAFDHKSIVKDYLDQKV